MDTLHEHLFIYTIFLKWEIFQEKCCRESQNTHFMFHNFFPKIMSFMRYGGKNILSLTGTHSRRAIRIAIPLQQ